jgi:NitT/TauT family transport system substrate-binding protein
MKGLYIRRLWPVLASAALAITLAACSSASSTSGTTTATNGSSAPELSTITIGVLQSSDDVTVQIAQDEGFFKQVGLNVKVVVMGSTNDATTGLLSHTLDFSVENYVGMFQQEKAVPTLNLRIVADNAQATPNLYVMMVGKNSPITSLSQLKGKKVGFPAKGFNFGAMASDVLLQPYHESAANFTTVVTPFQDAPAALASGEDDAVFTTEPFITIMEQKSGDRILQDLMTGPLLDYPEDCWGTTAAFATKYPKTTAAFAKAMGMALRLAASNTPLVRQELPKFIKTLTPKLASVIQLPTFNTTLSLARMQRVADTEERLGALPGNFDVKSMYDPPAGP